MLKALETIAGQLRIEIRSEEGEFEGGLCRLGSRQVVFVNRRLSPAGKAGVLARSLGQQDLSSVFILPAVREYIDRSGAKEKNSRS